MLDFVILYWNNGYIRALLILLLFVIIVRPTVHLLHRLILLLTAKTKTDLDDKFINSAYKPFAIVVILFGTLISLNQLPLSENIITLFSRIVYSVLSFLIAIIIYRFIDIVITSTVMSYDIDAIKRSLIKVILSTIKVIIFIIAGLFTLTLWGVQIQPFLAGLGIAGLAVALALQSTLSNIFSGIALVLDKTIKVGDLIYLDSTTKGKVADISLRSTKLVTFDNEYLVIPNNKLAEGMIQNVALPEPRSRVVVPFSVAYGVDIERVKKIVVEQINTITKKSKKDTPTVRFIEMGSSALLFKAYFYVDSYEDRFPSIDEANTKIYQALQKHKIEIPFPQLDVHIKKKTKELFAKK